VVVSDGRGGVAQDTAPVAVANVPPTAAAGGPYSGVAGSPISFSGNATDPGADVLTFEWDFSYDAAQGFQVEAAGRTPQYAYAQAGGYSVALRVSDDRSSTLATTTATVALRPAVTLYFSLGSSATLGGLSVANEDIVAFDGTGFSLLFDGSDVGLSSATIDAFAVISPSEILLSFSDARSVAGISGTVDDSDVVKFTATSLGTTTAGSFSMYFDASDVGLSTSDEDVDAIELLPNGHLLLSTTGPFSVSGASGEDEDLLEFTPTSLGATTAGAWKLYFDGSDVGLSSSDEDVDGLAVDAAGNVYLSTTGAFSVSGLSGADEDVFVFRPTRLGPTTAGGFGPGLFFDGSLYGLGGNDVFAIDLP
jgi:PKD repeat protein